MGQCGVVDVVSCVHTQCHREQPTEARVSMCSTHYTTHETKFIIELYSSSVVTHLVLRAPDRRRWCTAVGMM